MDTRIRRSLFKVLQFFTQLLIMQIPFSFETLDRNPFSQMMGIVSLNSAVIQNSHKDVPLTL